MLLPRFKENLAGVGSRIAEMFEDMVDIDPLPWRRFKRRWLAFRQLVRVHPRLQWVRRLDCAVADRFACEDRTWAIAGLCISGIIAMACLALAVWTFRYPYQNANDSIFFCEGFFALNQLTDGHSWLAQADTIRAVDFVGACIVWSWWVIAFACLSLKALGRRRKTVSRVYRVGRFITGAWLLSWLLTPCNSLEVKLSPNPMFSMEIGQGEVRRYSYDCDAHYGIGMVGCSGFRWTPRQWLISAGQGGFGTYYLNEPLWMPVLFFGLPTILLGCALRRLPDCFCRRCSYDLTCNTSGRCPECGTLVIAAVALRCEGESK